MADETATAPVQPPPAPAPPPEPIVHEPQLTQVRVPLADAADAFTVPDESGRFPIVVLTGERSRIRNEFLAAGVALLFVALVFDVAIAVRGALLTAGGALLVLAVFRSFLVRVPEGAQAMTLRRGRFDKTLPAGNHLLPPWVAVTHVVTKREIPFVASASQIPTSDGVRVDIDVLVTFVIEAAERFTYAISTPDFDLVLAAATQDALRQFGRGIGSQDVLDSAGAASDSLRASIGSQMTDYGVEVHKVVVVAVRPPADYMASLEARRLAEVQLAELEQEHVLDRQRQGDRIDLLRTHAEQQRKLLELEAANESLRLQMLEERISAYPTGAKWDFDTQRMDVAKALAGNDRAFLAVGDPATLTDALLVADRDESTPLPPTDQPKPRRARPPANQR